MPVRYIDNVQWIQRAQTVWTVDSWGCDRARVLYRGAATLKDAFEQTIKRWSAMPGFSNMRLAEWNGVEMTPSFPGIEVHYVGFRGEVPGVRYVDGTSLQTAQGAGTDTTTSTAVTGSFTYLASRTTWTWYEKTKPGKASRYNTVNDQVDPLTRIMSYHMENPDTGRPINTVPYSAFVAVFNSLVKKVVVSDYERELIVPDLIWACRADVDYKLIN